MNLNSMIDNELNIVNINSFNANDVALTSELYEPSMIENKYCDIIPNFNLFKNGIRCPCGTRNFHVYYNKQSFAKHIQTVKHITWLKELNINKKNIYNEYIKLKELTLSQKQIIVKLENELFLKKQQIEHLIKCLELQINQKNKDLKSNEID